MLQTAAQGGHHAARAGRPQRRRASRRWRRLLNCSNDDFIRTTEARHHRASQAIWERDGGERRHLPVEICRLVLGARRGLLRRERDRASDETACASAPQGTPVEWVEEESYFFRLSAYQDKLLELYDEHAGFHPAARAAQRGRELRAAAGCKDLSISRTTFDWGIPVPGDPKHVMYVWVDALTNYITGVGFPDDDSATFKRYWPADLHVIGKDIVRFHAVYWPAFLMSAGIALPQARLRPRLPVQPRREDVEVGRQRGRPVRAGRRLRRRSSCAISSCARCRSARTATTATRRSSTASTPISPTISAIWRSARCR